MLNMRSVEDLTARARVRDAAIDLFGRRGFERTTVRDIAAAAEVSPGLVLHHFGSKAELRDECSEFVVEQLFGQKDALNGPDGARVLQSWMQDYDRFRPLLRYIAHLLVDGSDAGHALFSSLVEGTRAMLAEHAEAGLVRDFADPQVMATYLTVFGLAPLILESHVALSFGQPEMSGALQARAALPLLDFFTHGLYTDDRFLRMAHDALDGDERS
ncbi:HTH-type transcriptional repressor KstR2 [Microbacterium sp. TNHR37B]|nr:HTH-type transcriptional repressor KstR2 [Microbacterium sp. TNHR37B]